MRMDKYGRELDLILLLTDEFAVEPENADKVLASCWVV